MKIEVDIPDNEIIRQCEKDFKNTKDPYGIPNCNFSLINNTDDRWPEFTKQRIERGFDDSELWSLFSTIAKYIYPRLKAFKEKCIGIPSNYSEERWDKELDKMCKAFKLIGEDKVTTFKEDEIIQEGFKSFYNNFFNLWS